MIGLVRLLRLFKTVESAKLTSGKLEIKDGVKIHCRLQQSGIY